MLRGRRAIRLSLAGVVALGISLTGPPVAALAHVEVVPAESAPGATERYGIRVPTEKPVPTVRVEVQFPPGLRVLDAESAAGWRLTVQRDATGRPVSAVWEGGSIPADEFGEFALRAVNPDTQAELRWQVIQTYQDGSEAQWLGPASAEFPAPATRVRSSGPLGSAEPLSLAALLVGLLALVVSVVALVLAGLAWRRRALA